MGPRLILSNAQKSAGTHAPIPAGGVVGMRGGFGSGAEVCDGAKAVLQIQGLYQLKPLSVNLTSAWYSSLRLHRIGLELAAHAFANLLRYSLNLSTYRLELRCCGRAIGPAMVSRE